MNMLHTEPEATPAKRSHAGLLFGIIFLGLGIVFLLREYGILDRLDFWPWILIVIGGALVITHFARAYSRQ
jgi:SNF family Na+-dependent transporter